MKKNSFFIGLDIAATDLVASIYQSPDQPIRTKEAIPNNPEGFRLLVSWLTEHHLNKSNSRICMEATGVYSKAVAYYLTSWGFSVSVEPPLKVKQAFDPVGHKTDPVTAKVHSVFISSHLVAAWPGHSRNWNHFPESVIKITESFTCVATVRIT